MDRGDLILAGIWLFSFLIWSNNARESANELYIEFSMLPSVVAAMSLFMFVLNMLQFGS